MPEPGELTSLTDSKSAYVRIRGQAVRDQIHLIIKTWIEMFPAECVAFARRARAWQKWYRETGPAAIVRRTDWLPTLKVPVRLDACMARQFRPTPESPPYDWMRDPTLLEIFVDELSLVKVERRMSKQLR